MPDLEWLVTTYLTVLMIPYFIAFLLYMVRVIKGPTLSDRVLAVDALGYDLAAFMIVLTLILRSPLLIVCGVALILWIFSLDIYVAKYLEARELGD
ncbi:MAG: monovalent cation/H+ antiporter complex subunit F [Desulfurococcaceae archaeon TW002]